MKFDMVVPGFLWISKFGSSWFLVIAITDRDGVCYVSWLSNDGVSCSQKFDLSQTQEESWSVIAL